jgi:hypothetical protein
MTITFEDDKDIIIYALEKIISYARNNQDIFLAQSIWWISSIIGLQDGLVIHIDNLRIRSEARRGMAGSFVDTTIIHPDRISRINATEYDLENWCDNHTHELSVEDSGFSSTSEGQLHDQVLQNCKKFLQESELARKSIARQSMQSSQRLSKQTRTGISKKKEPNKTY